jgi:hypothetical protein
MQEAKEYAVVSVGCVCAKGNVETLFAARGELDIVGQPCLVQG